ncbi:MAG: hypothetical protein ACJA13_002904 [Paraglaciecola sp.]|jgi:hypothetical protein
MTGISRLPDKHASPYSVKLIFRLGLLFQLCMICLGCGQPTLADNLALYQSRLAAVLDKPVVALPAVEPLYYPSLRQLKSPIPASNIAMKDFYALQGCNASLLIAQRNTPMGRTQLPSTRYIYETQLINALRGCVQSSADNGGVNTLLAEKITYLPLVWADLVQTSNEVRTAFSSNNAFLVEQQNEALSATHNALSYLLALQNTTTADAGSLEKHLQQLANYKLPAKVSRSQRLLAHQLNLTTLWLSEQKLSGQCPGGKPSQQVRYLKNVFQLFFIEKIQPLAGQLNHIQYQLLPVYQEFARSPYLNQGFKVLLERNQLEFTAYQEAMTQHIEFWQQLLAQCNLSPMVNSR